ncbi:hypothetical protein EV424DRAFT_846060 [Suillus variegatus]|nr:hypothetical protein EV424DRAFT_846060 [Suillus variegatus]
MHLVHAVSNVVLLRQASASPCQVRSTLYTLHHHVKPQPWHARSLPRLGCVKHHSHHGLLQCRVNHSTYRVSCRVTCASVPRQTSCAASMPRQTSSMPRQCRVTCASRRVKPRHCRVTAASNFIHAASQVAHAASDLATSTVTLSV